MSRAVWKPDLSGLLNADTRSSLSLAAANTLRLIANFGWEAVFGKTKEEEKQASRISNHYQRNVGLRLVWHKAMARRPIKAWHENHPYALAVLRSHLSTKYPTLWLTENGEIVVVRGAFPVVHPETRDDIDRFQIEIFLLAVTGVESGELSGHPR
jgi:hypothetical protein